MQRTTSLAICLTFFYCPVSGIGIDPVRLDREYYLYIRVIRMRYLVVSSCDCVSYVIFKGSPVKVLVRVISHLSIICLIINSLLSSVTV